MVINFFVKGEMGMGGINTTQNDYKEEKIRYSDSKI
jgi:hypothetical protein